MECFNESCPFRKNNTTDYYHCDYDGCLISNTKYVRNNYSTTTEMNDFSPTISNNTSNFIKK